MDKRQIEDCYALWEKAFGDTTEYMDYYFTEKIKDNQILSLYEGSQLTSMVHLNPYTIRFRGEDIRANYIVGVATYEEYRKQGRMRKLLEESFQRMREEGQIFTYLMPANEKIYKPFGFEYIYSQNRLHLGEIKREDGQIRTGWNIKDVEEITPMEMGELVNYTNQKLQSDFTVFSIRDKFYYKRLSKEMQAAGGNVKIFLKDGIIAGVLSYMLEDNICQVSESILEKDYTREILEGLFSLMPKGKKIQITFLESNFLSLTDVREMFPQFREETKPIIMAKLLGDTGMSPVKFFEKERIYLNEIV